MDAGEIATQLTLAIISKSSLFSNYTDEKQPAQRVADTYDVILTGVYKAMDNANKLNKK